MTTTTAARFEVAGRDVTMPVVVRDALAAAAVFLVPAAVASRWLPDPAIELIRPAPGRALLNLTAVHYRDNDLGNYHELSIALMVRETGSTTPAGPLALLTGGAGTYIHRLPVDEEFSRAAGVQIWGFPKTVEDLRVGRSSKGHVLCRWDAGDDPALRLAVSGSGSRSMPATKQVAYSTIDGRLHRTLFELEADGLGVRAGGARLELGQGPVADELRELGLPYGPVFSMSMGRMRARFEAPAPVHP